ncbi:hypothetical protein CBR_g55633 [Chara braunii]|uniref:Uncharacterized protein n=1 Tax=Chara braunii TaxID=69332 RepID=A0A388MD42_CHABU|nr:hypothetical protein CBR_g55633 [Chara braunii]|eukprot:GBG92481.1 hypothetical protein CBR_g55633 [Chara braunii]
MEDTAPSNVGFVRHHPSIPDPVDIRVPEKTDVVVARPHETCALVKNDLVADNMSSSRGEGEPAATSGMGSGKHSTKRSSTTSRTWSDHARSKWFVDWSCADATNPFQQPCGPVIFVEANKRRRVLGAVLRWENAKGSRRRFYMKNVYGSKGNVVAGAKGAVLDMCLFEGFGAGAANTPFYNDLRRQGKFVLGREFFNLLEDKGIALDVPCEVSPDLELSMPLQPCGGCESSGAAGEGGDLGSGEATHVQREDAREYKDGVRTRREFEISPAQIVGIREWEDLYNQRSLDPVLVETIREAMRSAFENKEQTYELPVFKLAPLGLQKPTPGTKALRLKPEEWKDELAGEYYYYAVCGQHKAATARLLLGSEVAKKYNLERWPARMVYFSDDDFEAYFLVSSQDNKEDLKAPPRQLKLSIKDIRWQWKHDGCPRAVMGNPSGKQDQVRAWHKFCTTALHKAPQNSLWLLADQKEEEAIKKQNVALRSYLPLAIAGENVWKLAVEFFEKWETGRLLSHDGAKWTVKKKKVKNVKPGVAYIHNDKLGRTEVVYNVPVDSPNKKGKKEKEEGDWFVQVPDPDAHCWKAMESLTDNEKCRVLKKVLACEVAWVQAGSPSLAKLEKLSVQDMVQLVKYDRVLVRLWNYYQFKHEQRSDADWIQRYRFLKSRSAVFKKFEGQGLDDELWDNSRKHVSDSALFKDCPPYMGCDQDNSIEVTEKLAGHKKLSVDWRNKVLSMLNGSRLKSREVALAEGVVHIQWKDTGDVTSIAPFADEPLEADIRDAELKEAVASTKSHTFVLDLCEPVDLKLWKPQAWETLNSYLQTWCPSHWTLIVFVLRQHNLSFLASMHHLSFVKLLEAKWVRRVQQKKSFPVGNNLYTEEDRMYILFKGDDLRVNTSVVYEGNLPTGVAAAVRLPQRFTQTDVSQIPFTPCDWSLVAPERQGSVYGDMERNPIQFVGLLDFLGKKGEGVIKVNSSGHNCEFLVVRPTRDKVWSKKTDMWFKLSERKRNKMYDFLFLQMRPRRDTDAEYIRRKDHMLALLDNYHFASHMNAKTFIERLQSLYFVESEEQLKLASYASLISTDDEEAIGVEFVANAKEEESDTESIDLQYDPPPADDGRGSSSAGPSPSAAALVSPLAKPAPGTTPMKLLERHRALAAPPPALRPGSVVPPDHPSWKDDNIHFLLEPQRHSPEQDWGHDMVWHPGVIQPAIRNGKWVMAVAIPGAGWVSFPRESKSNFLHLARISVLQKVKVENDTLAPDDLSLISTVGRLFDELQDKCWLELTEDYYKLDTSPSKGVVDWKVSPPSGSDGGSGGGLHGSGGDGGGDAGGGDARGGKGIPPMGERGSHGRNTTPGGSAGVAGFAVDRTPLTGTRPSTRHTPPTPRLHPWTQRGTRWQPWLLWAVARPESRSPPGFELRRVRSSQSGPECEVARGRGIQARIEKFAALRRGAEMSERWIIVPLRGAACTGTEGRSSRFGTGTAKGDEFRGREVGEEMEEQKGAQEGEEEGEEEVEEEEVGETELIDLFEGREGAGFGEDEVEHSEDDAGSGDSCDEFGQLYGDHHEDDVDDDATAIEMETQVVSSLSAEPEDYAVRPLTSAVDLQHRFDEASIAISPSEKSRRISIDEVIDGILGDHNVSARLSATANVASSVAAALASSPPKSLVLQATLAAEGEGECGGGQHVTSPKKSRFGGQALDVLALPAPNSPSKERREKKTGVVSSRTRRSSKYPEHILQKVPGLSKKHKDMLKASGVNVEIGKKEYTVAIEECLSLLAPKKGTYPRYVSRGQAMYEKYLATRHAPGDNV